MQIYYLSLKTALTVASLFALSACGSNPSHRPTIGGTIELISNFEKDLCFLPKFETAYLTSTVEYNDLKFINLSYANLSLGDDPLANKIVWEAAPRSGIYYKLNKGDMICMNKSLPELKTVKYTNLDNSSYTVVIGGTDDKKEYNLRFIERFEYPIQPK